MEADAETDGSKLDALSAENLRLKAALASRPQQKAAAATVPLVAQRDITPDEARTFPVTVLGSAMAEGKGWLDTRPPANPNASPPLDQQRAMHNMQLLEQEQARRQDEIREKLAQAQKAQEAADAKQAEEIRKHKEQWEKDLKLVETPPFWSYFDPTIARRQQPQHPLLRFQAETVDAAARGHANVVAGTGAVVTTVAAGVVVLAVTGLAISATASLIAEAVGEATIARGYVLAVKLTVENPQAVEFIAGQVFKIALGGGILAFIKSPSAEGALELIHDVIIAYSIVPRGGSSGGSGTLFGHVDSANEDGSLTVRVTPGAGTRPPGGAPAAQPPSAKPPAPAKAPAAPPAPTTAPPKTTQPPPSKPVPPPKPAAQPEEPFEIEPTQYPKVGAVDARRPPGFWPAQKEARATPGRDVKPGTLEDLEKTRPVPKPRGKGPTRQEQLKGIDPKRQTNAQVARREFDSKFRDEWAERLDVGPGGVVDHARELQILDKYPGAYTQDELNALRNMRGIRKEHNNDLHLSALRKVRDPAYERLDDEIDARGLKPGTPEYRQLVRDVIESMVFSIDEAFGEWYTEYGKNLRGK